MPYRSASARALPGVGEATATTSPASARMRKDAQWISAWKPEPMTPILTLFMTLLGAHDTPRFIALGVSLSASGPAGADESGPESIPIAAKDAEAELDGAAPEVISPGGRHQQGRCFR